MSTNFHGFDLSALLGNATEVKTPVKEKAVTPHSMELDAIDLIIRDRALDKNPSKLNIILKELGLTKFWKQLNSATTIYSVLGPLAINRMLNFFEGATASGMGQNDIRIGMVVSAATSTFMAPQSSRHIRLASATHCPSFMSSDFSLDEFTIPKMTEAHKKSVYELIALFSRGDSATTDIRNHSSIGVYLNNSMKMWILSDDQNVLDIMTELDDRHKYLNPNEEGVVPSIHKVYLGMGNVENYKYDKAVIFTTPWASGKAMTSNAPRRFNQIKPAYA